MSNKNTAKETLKNTGIVGGSQLITIFIRVIRTKFIAILLGPSGIGLIQLLTATIDLIKSISNLGIGFSGVRDIAESFGAGNEEKIAKTIITLKRWSWVTGVLGVILTVLFSKRLSVWTFGNEEYTLEIAILSSTIYLGNIAAGYGAVIRGARRMSDFARISIFNAFIGSIIAIIIYYLYGVRGIVPVLLITGIVNLLLNIFFSRKIKYPTVKISYRKSFANGIDMVKLGVFTVITGFISQLSLYYVRVSINDNLGQEFVGYYTVATTLAVSYLGMIFTAMSADYFPKVSAINRDNKALNNAIIEQTKILLLLGTPLIVAMFTFSEYLIHLLYSKEFIMANPLLMWMLLSVFLRLIGFPIGFVFLAKGKGKIFIFTQSLWNIIFVGFVYSFWHWKGDLEGVGVAFTMAYIIGVLVNIIIIKRLTALRYDKETLYYITVFSIITTLYFLVFYLSRDNWVILMLKIVGLVLLSIYSFKKIEDLIGTNIISLLKKKILKK